MIEVEQIDQIFEFSVGVETRNELLELMDWLEDYILKSNIEIKMIFWSDTLKTIEDTEYWLDIKFWHEEDAVAFKLRWS